MGFAFMSAAHRSLYLAYGGLYALGGYTAWWALRYDYTVWGALSLAVIGCVLAGGVSYGLFYIVLSKASGVARLLTGLGLLICMQESYRLGIGPYRFKVVAFGSHQIHHIGPLMLTDVHWFVFGGVFVSFMAIQGFLRGSETGRALDAFLQSNSACLAQGEMHRLRWLASGIGAGLAGVGGVLGVLYLNEVHPSMGTMIIHKIMVVVLIGTFGNLHSVVLVSFSVAVIEGVLLPAMAFPVPFEAVLLILLVIASSIRSQRTALLSWLSES
jgi:branched-subunit amino acid ABC-type transport system permease component